MNSTEINLPIYQVPIWLIEFLATNGKPLQGSSPHYFLVEAENKTKARLSLTNASSFWKNYNKLPVEERKKLEPFRLRRKGKIEQILECDKRHKNKRGEFTCGIPVSEMPAEEREFYSPDSTSGEFGMCCIAGYDPFDSPDCPYNKEI